MSAHYVRALTEQWLIALGTPTYHGTVNLEQTPGADVWMTAEWTQFGNTKETYCQTFVEDGEIRLMFFGAPGVGWDQLFLIAEAAAEQFFLNTDPNQKLVLTVIDPPDEFSSQSEPWFVVEVSVSYQYRK